MEQLRKAAQERLLLRIRKEIRDGWESYGRREVAGEDHLPMFGPDYAAEARAMIYPAAQPTKE